MKAQLSRLAYNRLRTEELFGLHKRVLAEVKLLTGETNKQIVAEYEKAVNDFDIALKSVSFNTFTKQLNEYDKATDDAWRGLSAQAKVSVKHPMDQVRMAGESAIVLLNKYGNITKMAFNEKYGSIHNMLQDFEKYGEKDATAAYLLGWINQLKSNYEKVMSIAAKRDAEQAKRPVGEVKRTRIASEKAIRQMCQLINAHILVNGEEQYIDFVDKVNVIFDQMRSVLQARTTRTMKAIAEDESEQPNRLITPGRKDVE